MRNTELKERIRELQHDKAYQEKIFEVREQKIRLEEKEKRTQQAFALTEARAENKQLIARMDEHPYQLVSDMLKALVVKFPTLNINDLAINSGKK